MIDRFTFSNNDLDSFLLNANHILPGIEKMMGIYYDKRQDSVIGKSYTKEGNNGEVEDLQIKHCKEIIGGYRIGKTKFQWYAKDELPFELESKPKKVKTIFHELENVVLLVRFTNSADNLKDLLFVYFNKNFGNFGLSNSSKKLSTENKQIIATLLVNYFNTQIEQNKQNRSLFDNIKAHTNGLIGQLNSVKMELERTRSNYGESLSNLCIEYARQFSIENKRNYQLSDEALNKIKTFKGNIKYLNSIIRNSIVFAENISTSPMSDEILIKDYHINLDSFDTEADSQGSNSLLMEKSEKAVLLLDKLENAARTVIGRHKNLTSSNVGDACPVPISAPAITDALKKHGQTIMKLFDTYPEKWEVIRKDFRPIRNLINLADREKLKSA
jgi:hypothetical protein